MFQKELHQLSESGRIYSGSVGDGVWFSRQWLETPLSTAAVGKHLHFSHHSRWLSRPACPAQDGGGAGTRPSPECADLHAPPGVTALPAAAMRTGHMRVAFFTPRCSARAIRVSWTASAVQSPMPPGRGWRPPAWPGRLGIRLGFLVGEALHAVVRQLVEEITFSGISVSFSQRAWSRRPRAHINDGFFTASRI